MESFEELGVSVELTEALAAEGIERPTPLQEAAIPMLRKGNHLVVEAGPGSGLHLAWLLGLLEVIEPGGERPRLLVACASADTADRLAQSTARIAAATGHSVAALGSAWVLPDRADLLFGSCSDILAALGLNELDASEIQCVVVDQAHLMDDFGGLDAVERILDYLPSDIQRIVSALPLTPAVDSLAERLLKRAMTLPAPVGETPKRGQVRFRIAPEPREAAALRVISELFTTGARHALVYCRNEDRAADVGDYLTLHGFTAGAPGDEALPVWLGVDALEARSAAKDVEGLVVVSCDVPADADTLDRRHSIGDDSVIVVLPREVPHLRRLGKLTGYDTVPFPPPEAPETEVDRLRAMVERAIQSEDTAPYLLAIEPLFERYDPAEVAAAMVALLRRKGGDGLAAGAAPAPTTAAARATGEPAWAKLFVGVGERDGVRPGDLVGAITGEAGVPGEAVGRIDVKESHTIVEVHDGVARQVIQAINGTTIKGRSVRVDFDRPRRTARKPRR